MNYQRINRCHDPDCDLLSSFYCLRCHKAVCRHHSKLAPCLGNRICISCCEDYLFTMVLLAFFTLVIVTILLIIITMSKVNS